MNVNSYTLIQTSIIRLTKDTLTFFLDLTDVNVSVKEKIDASSINKLVHLGDKTKAVVTA